MSVRRLNYTGRLRISRDRVQVSVSGTPPNAVVGATFQIGDLEFPATARVVLEAQAGWTLQRFEMGTVGQYVAPADPHLSEFTSTIGLLFRLKVIATGDAEGQLLGEADGLRPSDELDKTVRQSFIKVRPQDLGERVWKLDLDAAQPLLLVNSRLDDHQDFLKRREVAALVLPEVLERMLHFAGETGEEDEDSGDDWRGMVLRMGARLSGREAPPSTDADEFELWVDEAVGAFSRSHHLLSAFVDDSAGSGS